MVVAAGISYMVYYLQNRAKRGIRTIFVKGSEETSILFELLGTNLTFDVKMSSEDAVVCEEFFIETLKNLANVSSMAFVKGSDNAVDNNDPFFSQNRKYFVMEGSNGKMLLVYDLAFWNKETTIGDNYDVSSYAGGNGTIPVIENCFLRIPTSQCDETCQLELMDAVRTAITQTRVKRNYPQAEKPVSNLFHLAKKGEHYMLRSTPFNFTSLDPAHLDLCYEPSTVVLDRDYEKVPMSKVVEIVEDMARNGKNSFLLGPTGVGKTTICRSMWAKLVNEGYMVIKLDYDLINGPQSEIQTALEENILPVMADRLYKGVVFVMDEARSLFAEQRHNDVLLDLMDGIRKKEEFPMSVMISINAKPEDLDYTLLRSGRTHLVAMLTYLSENRANALAKHIQQTRPDLQFLPGLMNNILQNGKWVEGVQIYPKGMISAADIWYTVFRPMEDYERYAKQLEPFAAKKQSVPGPSSNGSKPAQASVEVPRAKVIL